jgi:hypothetical protein
MPISNVEVTIENTQIPGVVNNVPVGPTVVQVNQGPAGPAGLSFANPMIQSGDLIIGGSQGEPTRLPRGSTQNFLGVDGTSLLWYTSDSSSTPTSIAFRDAGGGSSFRSVVVDGEDAGLGLVMATAPGDVSVLIRSDNATGNRVQQLPDEDGTIAVKGQPRGQMWFQNNSTPITLSTNYQKIDVSSAALDEPIDFDDPVDTRMTYTGATPKVLNVIATVDLYHASGGPMEASVKLRFNDDLIDATQCNATIANQSVGKLHTMWMIEFDTNDYIELWVAATSGTPQVTPVRMRMQVTPLL